MTIDLLTQLDALARSATSDIEKWTYRAQWACALARFGHTERARSEIATLRACNTVYAPKVTAWIFLAEGLVDHFESLSTTAADRFKRAYGLAVALVDPDIRSLAAAWLGASEYLMGRYEEACLHAAEAIQHAPTTGTLALSRAHLVLANCLYGFGAESLASKHYSKARHFAIEARDISMQSAILYNVAAFHISRLSLEDAFGEASIDQIKTAELELNSISNLDQGLRLGSLPAMVPLLRAQLLLTKKEWGEADALYSRSIAEAAEHGQLRLAARYLAEQAYCQAMLGLHDSAAKLVSDAVTHLSDRTELDDRAACHARLSRCLALFGQESESSAHAELGRMRRSDFSEFQKEFREKIVPIAEGTTI